jgi:hypothetical protein
MINQPEKRTPAGKDRDIRLFRQGHRPEWLFPARSIGERGLAAAPRVQVGGIMTVAAGKLMQTHLYGQGNRENASLARPIRQPGLHRSDTHARQIRMRKPANRQRLKHKIRIHQQENPFLCFIFHCLFLSGSCRTATFVTARPHEWLQMRARCSFFFGIDRHMVENGLFPPEGIMRDDGIG